MTQHPGTRRTGNGRVAAPPRRGGYRTTDRIAFQFRHCGEPMSSKPSNRIQSETTDERTIRLLHDEIADLHGQAGRANDREVDLAASLLAAESRLLDSGVMLHEVNHRAKNSIQIAMSLLGLQMHATQSEEVRLELASAIRRLGNIAAAHLMLNSQSPDEQRTSFRAYLTLICTETHQSLGGERIALIVRTDELALDTSRAINLALIASEALTNAMKYAFPMGVRARSGSTVTTTGKQRR